MTNQSRTYKVQFEGEVDVGVLDLENDLELALTLELLDREYLRLE